MEDTPDVVDTMTGHVNQTQRRVKLIADQVEIIDILKGRVKPYDAMGNAIIGNLTNLTKLLGESMNIEPDWVQQELDRRKKARETA